MRLDAGSSKSKSVERPAKRPGLANVPCISQSAEKAESQPRVVSWEQRFHDHAVHEKINLLEGLLEEVDAIEEPDSARRTDIRRALHIVRRLQTRLRQADPLLVSPQQLDASGSSVDAAIAAISQFKTSKDPVHLAEGTNRLDQLPPTIAAIIPGEQSHESRRVQEELRKARRTILAEVSNMTAGVRTQEAAAKAALADVETKLKAAAEDMAAKTAAILADSTAKLEALSTHSTARLNEIGSKTDALGKQVETSIKQQQEFLQNFQRDFLESQSKRLEDAQKTIGELRAKFEEFQGTKGDEFAQGFESWKGKADADLKLIQDMRIHSQRLGDAAARGALAQEYNEAAEDAKKSAFSWRMAGLILLGLGTAFFVVSLFLHRLTGEDFEGWNLIVYRMSGAVLFSATASICLFIASGFNKKHFTYKTVYMQLSAISPYLADLKTEKQHEIKERLAYAFFTPPDFKDDEIHRVSPPAKPMAAPDVAAKEGHP